MTGAFVQDFGDSRHERQSASPAMLLANQGVKVADAPWAKCAAGPLA